MPMATNLTNTPDHPVKTSCMWDLTVTSKYMVNRQKSMGRHGKKTSKGNFSCLDSWPLVLAQSES
jgi:hypothetical protein